TGITPEEHEAGKSPSVWLAMANQADTLTPLRRRGWRPARMDSTQPLWTDDYSSLLRVFKWH
ncbi:MAG TPA: hypothetical protein VHF69_13180, partial [Candidatus Synoicihabitans sp.]|nr:hypothetical protein [Candidatus Synoicihabitans sp.]